jgi:Tfp pilus assembly protein PilF
MYLVDIGKIDAGIQKLQKAIEIDPGLGQAHAWLAKAYYKNGNSELARQAAEKAKALGYRGKITWQSSEE